MRPPLTRRRLLALAGTTLPVGGCLGSSADDGTSTAGTPGPSATTGTATASPDGPVRLSPGERNETPAGWSVTVDFVAVRHGISRFGTVHVDPAWRSGAQFVVADVVLGGPDAPDPDDLFLFVRTDTIDRSDRVTVYSRSNARGRRRRYGFPVPTDPAPSRAAVVWRPEDGTSVRWALDDGAVRALGAAPEFGVESFDVPATAVSDDEFEATLVVGNEGERDGTFLAEVGTELISDQPEFTLDVPVGETVTGHPRVEAYFGDREELSVVLRWEGGTERRTVRRA